MIGHEKAATGESVAEVQNDIFPSFLLMDNNSESKWPSREEEETYDRNAKVSRFGGTRWSSSVAAERRKALACFHGWRRCVIAHKRTRASTEVTVPDTGYFPYWCPNVMSVVCPGQAFSSTWGSCVSLSLFCSCISHWCMSSLLCNTVESICAPTIWLGLYCSSWSKMTKTWPAKHFIHATTCCYLLIICIRFVPPSICYVHT